MKIPAFVLLLLCFASCTKYNPDEVDISKDFTFTIEDTAGVRADGVSVVTLHFKNTKPVKDGMTVVFASNKGAILQDKQDYTDNDIKAKLILAEDTGLYVITASLKEGDDLKILKSIVVAFRPAYAPLTYRLELLDTINVHADGIAAIGLKFTAADLQKQNLTVHFESSAGTLIQQDVPLIDGVAQTRLTVAQSLVNYVIKAQLKDGSVVKAEQYLIFSLPRARPDAINLQLSSSYWSQASSLTIKTFLTRVTGSVTAGQQVDFKAYQLGNSGDINQVGRFEGLFNNSSSTSGSLADITLTFDTPGVDTTKPVTIEASALNDAGKVISKTVVLPYK